MATKKRQSDVSPGSVLAEYIGTFMLAFAVLASINGVVGEFIPLPVVAGFTLFLSVMTIGSISGSHINPGVTLGLWSLKKIDTVQALSYIIAQIAGAFSAAAVMNTFLDGAMLTVAAGDFDMRILFAEIVGMIIFTFGVAAAVLNEMDGVESAATVGGSLFLGIIFASVLSNAVLNPAVAFAIDSVSVTYLLGPVIGGMLGMNLYSYVKSQG